ncbi:MAG: hypothetical protein LC804_09190 [Acidobacteria bacterium]|nr:hypothetical protein [Acidobacteriota bacterium]
MADYLDALANEGPALTALTPPRDIPVVVISAVGQEQAQLAAHHALADAAERAVHVMARRSTHWIQFGSPS